MILDTNAVSGILSGDRKLETILASRPVHELPVIVIGEYAFGLARSEYKKSLSPLFDALIAESTVLEVQRETATFYAKIRDGLRKKGRPIPENDIWIAALAMQHELAIVTKDQDFHEIPGIRTIHW